MKKKVNKRFFMPISTDLELYGIIALILSIIVYGVLSYVDGNSFVLVISTVISIALLTCMKKVPDKNGNLIEIRTDFDLGMQYPYIFLFFIVAVLVYLAFIQFKSGAFLYGLISLAGVFAFIIAFTVIWLTLRISKNKKMDKNLVEKSESNNPARFYIEGFPNTSLATIDLNQISSKKIKIFVEDFGMDFRVPREILQKAKEDLQQLPKADIWIYKDYIFTKKPENNELKGL